jgi:hypothetical protein
VETEATLASSWTQVSSGNAQSCAITTTGQSFCWGDGRWGQLGNRSPLDSGVAVEEHFGGANWSLVTAGQHSCGVKDDGRLFCWGAGSRGGLGVGPVLWPIAPAN